MATVAPLGTPASPCGCITVWVQKCPEQEAAAEEHVTQCSPPLQCSPSPAAMEPGWRHTLSPRGTEPWSRRRWEPHGGLAGQLGLLAVLLAPAPSIERCQLPETWPPAPQVGEVLLRATGPGVDGAQGGHGGVRALEGVGLE